MIQLLLVAIFLAVVVGPILAIISLVKSREIGELRKRMEGLESRIRSQEIRLRATASPGGPREEPASIARPAPFAATPTTRPPTADPQQAPAPAPPAAGPRPVVPAPEHGARSPVSPEVPRPVHLSASRPSEAPPDRGPARPTVPPPPLSPPTTHVQPPSPMQPARIDWERWIGIRGAAVLGGIALALAGLLFFQYSIQRGLITPPMRVALGIVVGIACLVASELLRPRGFRAAAEGVSGAGVTILYAAIWAAHSLYQLLGGAPTFVLMALVTATCGWMAVRHSSQVVAVFGLIGGFATPLLLRTESDRPVGLFGYVLLLDLGLLAVGKKKGWPLLGMLGLAGTALLQILWFRFRMDPEHLLLGLAILAVFAAAFAVVGQIGDPDRRKDWIVAQAAGVMSPFVFAAYFASRVDLGDRLVPIALLVALLCAAAGWVARANRTPWLGMGAAVGSLGVIAAWLAQRQLTESLAWETAIVAVALSAVLHVFVELDRESAGFDGPAPAALIVAGGFLMLSVLAAAASRQVSLSPWLAAWLGLSAILYRHAAFPGRAFAQPLAAILTAVGISGFHLCRPDKARAGGVTLFVGLLVGLALIAQVAAALRRRPDTHRMAQHAAAGFAVVVLASLAPSDFLMHDSLVPLLIGAFLLSLLAALAATRIGSGEWLAAAMLASGSVFWIARERSDLVWTRSGPVIFLAFAAASVALFTLWPVVARRAFAASPGAWTAAALSGPFWFFPMRRVFVSAFGNGFIGVLPVGLGALALAAALASRRIWPESDPIRKRALVWLSAVAVSFVSVAIPLQLDKEWIIIGWALEGLALAALWTRLDHPGLKWLSLAALAAATLRLVANPALLSYYPRSGTPVLNWILYTYLVPAAALFGSARLFHPLEVGRVRAWEIDAYRPGKPLAAIAAGIAAIAVVFVWINLAVADWFTEGPTLTLRFGRSPARDLTVSIAWALYGMILLLVGMARDIGGLRWVSLSFLVVTIGKVFLYDLGELRDLYRVASLVGLAVSLLLVSLLYQRFVFRKEGPERAQ